MTPFYLALGAATLAGVLVALSELAQRDKIASLLCLVCLASIVTLKSNWTASGGIATGSLNSIASYADGRPVETVLELYGVSGERRVRGLPLTAPIPWLKQVLLLLSLLTLLGFLASFRSRWRGPFSKREKFDMGAVLILTAVGAGLAFLLPDPASSQESIRSFVGGFTSQHKIESFSLPTGDWRYRFSGLDPSGVLGYCLALAILILLKPVGFISLKQLKTGLALVGLVMISSVLWRASLIGGFPWHSLDSAVSLSSSAFVFSVALSERSRVLSTLAMGSAIPLIFAVLSV
ncbi:MAG: hypothetical protein CMH52_12110 [Myxococcales bacterium]|nr:hypothetical protein [Myxococcales bacterium]|tara:strand:+ start:1156 stop:2031 length:876 start_codon:yes stop_codon:yes gene_type:complete